VAGVVAGHDGYADLRWFPAAAPRVFGHHGAGGQLCWLDPDTGMSFCFLHDTLEQHPGVELTRIRGINTLAHACVRS
jgi:CubicO group peptidase (beta-lactamase class C family)